MLRKWNARLERRDWDKELAEAGSKMVAELAGMKWPGCKLFDGPDSVMAFLETTGDAKPGLPASTLALRGTTADYAKATFTV